MISIKQLEDSGIPSSQVPLVFESRMLWRDLTTWIQAYLVSVFAGFGNQNSVEEKIRTVIVKFGNNLSTVFGGEIGEQYIGLITNWINTFKLLVNAQINDDADTVNEYMNQLYENINQMAIFLSEINPFWAESEWKALLYRFNEIIIEQLSAFLYKEYTKNIEAFDKLLNLTSIIGNYYSKGMLNYLTYSG
ncbi:hypothetical protein Ami103574_04390 [Aminipila butyrica]|uniref:Uncharacterized protein n=1 Tax=Aminipila butyrica TaxID=433296 RepID=A0A858BU48_9FIRM|nr:hypothetical protein [Aminipila butyrica]QIB68605.1 hypothetical protein Ami103574_04390 [Aminipila butyrica]